MSEEPKPAQEMPESVADPKPARTDACPFCLRKHLLKIRGYAREVAEDQTREWEQDNLLENLLLAEDHAAALGEATLAGAVRSIRLAAESGSPVADAAAQLYTDFKARFAAKLQPTTQNGEF